MAGAAQVGQPLDLLLLELKSKITAYRNALAWHQGAPGVEPEAEGRVADARAELGLAAAALAVWCGADAPAAAPESHGVRRARIAGERMDEQRRRARALAEACRCTACAGTGRRPGLDLEPCAPCGGQGVL